MNGSNKRSIGFAPPPIDQDSIEAVTRVLRSGWITSGPELKQFEAELSAYLKVSDVACFSSWTTACELALRWYGVGKGDEVIIPAMTYAATANIVLHCGATPVMVDIEPRTGLVHVDALRAVLTPRTKAVMPVDLCGLPVDYKAISQWINSDEVCTQFQPSNEKQRGLGRPLFLVDAAHSFGASIDGVPVGGQADITGFSFHAVKNLTTAEGGALAFALDEAFDMSEVLSWFKAMAVHGQSRSALEKTTGKSWHYDVHEAGYKCNMTDIQAALGRTQLAKYPQQLNQRKALAERYILGLSAHTWSQPPTFIEDDRISSYHLFALRIQGFDAKQRDQLMQRLHEDGVATNVHFQPLPMLSVHRQRGESIKNYPQSAAYFNEQISLPLHLQLDFSDVDYVVDRVVHHVQIIFQEKI